MRWILLIVLLIVSVGCSWSFEERMETMKQFNATGCSYLSGSGTPPASRLDGAIIGAWGEGVTIKDCPEIFKGLK